MIVFVTGNNIITIIVIVRTRVGFRVGVEGHQPVVQCDVRLAILASVLRLLFLFLVSVPPVLPLALVTLRLSFVVFVIAFAGVVAESAAVVALVLADESTARGGMSTLAALPALAVVARGI